MRNHRGPFQVSAREVLTTMHAEGVPDHLTASLHFASRETQFVHYTDFPNHAMTDGNNTDDLPFSSCTDHLFTRKFSKVLFVCHFFFTLLWSAIKLYDVLSGCNLRCLQPRPSNLMFWKHWGRNNIFSNFPLWMTKCCVLLIGFVRLSVCLFVCLLETQLLSMLLGLNHANADMRQHGVWWSRFGLRQHKAAEGHVE